ncbi:hypothetical protein CEXT_367791 [Caerostris extrusa]|uniref:Uncharacterized protein n=1 Tax=Caerostris extrusa TaxID=172846 RepID=A0AAV4QK31_CAEEX|nr:hypothetical protein CEXT_367791 [Caerostris extrusa]
MQSCAFHAFTISSAEFGVMKMLLEVEALRRPMFFCRGSTFTLKYDKESTLKICLEASALGNTVKNSGMLPFLPLCLSSRLNPSCRNLSLISSERKSRSRLRIIIFSCFS